jgi:hypothetical protein
VNICFYSLPQRSLVNLEMCYNLDPCTMHNLQMVPLQRVSCRSQLLNFNFCWQQFVVVYSLFEKACERTGCSYCTCSRSLDVTLFASDFTESKITLVPAGMNARTLTLKLQVEGSACVW